ncbi:MAG TPA: extensin family protein [Kofleriaceae bacterium]|nr:extensin family protein [Kofleriaceae bacterium]
MRLPVAVWLLVMACGSSSDEPITISFVEPALGASFARDELGPSGAVSAMVPFEVAISGAPTRIALSAGARAFDLESNAGLIDVRELGPLTLTATAYDGEDIVATAEIDVEITDLALATCRDWLDAFEIEYTAGPAMPGVVDPVTAKVPINGVAYKAVGAMSPRTKLFGDCRLIKSLVRAAPALRERDVTQVTDYGVYNYRCIGGGTPPNCPNGISQHAYAMAIDLAGFTTSDGAYASVNDDWVIDPNSEKTCNAPAEVGPDAFLHELICALKAAKVWNIVLTPNYNADHRNHFHVDLTPGSDFIERRDATVVYGD